MYKNRSVAFDQARKSYLLFFIQTKSYLNKFYKFLDWHLGKVFFYLNNFETTGPLNGSFFHSSVTTFSACSVIMLFIG